jgi:hypothetical protein
MLNSDLLVGVFSLAVAALVYFLTRDLSRLGGVFVNYVLTILVFLSVLEIIKGLVKPDRITFFESVIERNNIFVGLAMLALYLAVLPLVGFLPSSYCYFTAMTLYLGEDRFSTKNILVSALLSVLVVTAFYVIFRHVLEVPLPEGSLFE